MTAAKLHLGWCSYEAAKYAVEHWHYSRSMPASSRVSIGVWEDDAFIGVVIFSPGANQWLGQQFGLTQFEVCELTRVALRRHRTPVTRIIRIAITMLRRQCPGLRVIFSYADCDQDHHGGIYAGGNWTYLGKVQLNGGTARYRIGGRVMHGRSVGSRGWMLNIDWLREHVDPKAEKVYTKGKHKYAMGLDAGMRARLAALHQPYPKRAGGDLADTSADQAEEGGSIPTPALCST